jgi:hypothetical protein
MSLVIRILIIMACAYAGSAVASRQLPPSPATQSEL